MMKRLNGWELEDVTHGQVLATVEPSRLPENEWQSHHSLISTDPEEHMNSPEESSS
jgi:hypothetical protein